MSHFALLVALGAVSQDQVHEELERRLQPFHEFECTGVLDKHVVFVDCHDDIVAQWDAKTNKRLLVRFTGELIDTHDDRLYRELTLREKKAAAAENGGHLPHGGICKALGTAIVYFDSVPKIRDPLGTVGEVTEVLVAASEVYPSIEAYARSEGYDIHEGRIGNWTNPNRKWDWWKVGGRYADRLTLRDGTTTNIARKGDIALEAMGAARVAARHNAVQEAFQEIREGSPELSETHIREIWRDYVAQIAEARAACPEGANFGKFVEGSGRFPAIELSGRHLIDRKLGEFIGAGVPDTEPDIDAWIAAAPAISAFALLAEDGQWIEKGEMGMFAMVFDEKEDWSSQFETLFSNISDDCVIAIVDCHI